MNERPRDYLVTYDPDFLEEHSESSEFEESITSLGPRNSKQYLLIRENLKSVTKKQKDILNRKISNAIFSKNGNNKNHERNLHRLEDKKAQTSTKFHHRNVDKVAEANEHRNLNKDDQSNYTQKKSLMRHKVIPCLSNMFERSISKLTPKENQLKNISKDNCCQVEIGNDEQIQRRKHKKQQKLARQPVYTLEHVTQETIPFNDQKNIQHDQNNALKKVYSNIICNVTLSEDESEELVQLKRKKCKKQLRSEKREGKLKHRRSTKSYEQQFPSKKDLYQVYTTNQRQYDDKIIPPRKESESSGFWDFLVDKFNKKYQTKKPEGLKQYFYRDFGVQCCPISLETFGPKRESKRHRKHVDACPDDDCPCGELMLRYAMSRRQDSSQNIDSTNINPTVPTNRNQTSSKSVQCECSTSTQTRRPTMAVQRPSPPMQEKTCSCQRPHDQLTEHLASKYNGEILCIHNPPCILINGCLNVAQPQERSTVHAWPVIETQKDVFRGNKKDKNKKQICENFKQHHEQSFEVRQCNNPEYTNEKVIQSVCNHTPPCEVIRCCHKERYDPKLQNSCVHVPMCQRVPECVLHNIRENQPLGTCNHKPKCSDVPLCTRKYVAITTRDSIGTQVKPQTKMLCRHDPPCVLIPKCLGRPGHETYISYEAAPNCVHQPLCDLIPACCRKPTKGMVNAYSQYPNGCRVV